MPLIPSPWPVAHIARWIDESSTDAHGNHPVTEDPPVIRHVYELIHMGRRGMVSSRELMSEEFQERIETRLRMSCYDPNTYKHSDQVILFPEVDGNGDYVPDTGFAYFVDGDPVNDRIGPWKGLIDWTGGTIRLKRVT